MTPNVWLRGEQKRSFWASQVSEANDLNHLLGGDARANAWLMAARWPSRRELSSAHCATGTQLCTAFVRQPGRQPGDSQHARNDEFSGYTVVVE